MNKKKRKQTHDTENKLGVTSPERKEGIGNAEVGK